MSVLDAAVLTAGDLEATVVARAAMVVTSLRHRGAELLHPRAGLAAYVATGATMGVPLLHPWANRLDADAFGLGGRSVRLPEDPAVIRRDGNGLATHGLVPGTDRWSEATREDDALTGALDHGEHPAFPFPHRMTVRTRLHPEGLDVETTLTPTGDVAVPVSFGWHPYLTLPGVPRRAWLLTLPARRRLDADARGIPTGTGAAEPAEEAPLGDRELDHGYDDLPPAPALALTGGGRRVTVAFTAGYPCAQVFAPGAQALVALEPMTAPTNALVSGTGLAWAQPGDAYVARFSITVADWT